MMAESYRICFKIIWKSLCKKLRYEIFYYLRGKSEQQAYSLIPNLKNILLIVYLSGRGDGSAVSSACCYCRWVTFVSQHMIRIKTGSPSHVSHIFLLPLSTLVLHKWDSSFMEDSSQGSNSFTFPHEFIVCVCVCTIYWPCVCMYDWLYMCNRSMSHM